MTNLTAIIFLSLLPRPAAAEIHRPSANELAAIQQELNDAQTIWKKFEAARVDRELFKGLKMKEIQA